MYQILTTAADSEIAHLLINPKFSPGQVVATPAALEAMETHQCSPLSLLARHLSGQDWGELDASDAKSNDDALQWGGRLLSSYLIGPGTKIWLITDQCESGNVTTYLLPADY